MGMSDTRSENAEAGNRGIETLKTDASLLQALRAAASRRLTSDEVERQRISFVRSSLKDMNSISRERIRDILDEQEGRKIA